MNPLIKKRTKATNVLLIFLPIVCAIICMGLGRFYISPHDVVIDLYKIIFFGPESVDDQIYSVLIKVRLPRIILAFMCGAGLSLSGAAFQSIFSNALATPNTLGVSAGASFGAALSLFLGAGLFLTQVVGLIVGLFAVILTYFISKRHGIVSIIMVILTGLVVSALFEAGISIIKVFADPLSKLPAITFWLMGSLSGISYGNLLLASPFIIGGIVIIFLLRWKLNILSLHEDEAQTLGVNVTAMRLFVAVGATMITAACVSLCGQIGWVGLLVPHACRMLFGNNNIDIVPTSISLGAVFLLFIDTFARAATAAEIPISILTAVIGAPLFIVLLRKSGGISL